MLDTTKTNIATEVAFCIISILTPSKIDLQSTAGQHGGVESLRARLCNLQVGGQVTPWTERGVVIQLDSLFVALREAGLTGQQILNLIRHADVKVRHAHRVVFPAGHKAACAEAERNVPAKRK